MRIALAAYRCRDNDIEYNLESIERGMREASGRADMICFGEAFLQGFDSLVWDFERDKETAVTQDSAVMRTLCEWTVKYGLALVVGYMERDGESIYSSCAVLDGGRIKYNYRRVSIGWKEFELTDDHYKEGESAEGFTFRGKNMQLALCGDLWDKPGLFTTEGTLIWPVYLSYSPEEWENTELEAYAEQAGCAAAETLMVNPLVPERGTWGGACVFRGGKTADRAPLCREAILFAEL